MQCVRISVCLFIAISSCSPVLAGPAADAEPAPPLRLVGDKDYPPLTYLDSGVPKGLDVDIARALAGRLRRELRIELMDWSEAQRQALRGDADGVLSMSITSERQALYDFAEPTVTHEFGWFVRRGEGPVPGTADVESRRVGVTAGGYPRQFLEARGAGRLVLIGNYEDGLERVADGTLDAVAADSWVAASVIQRRGLTGIRFNGVPFAALPGAIAFRKGGGAAIGDINAAIRQMKDDGTLAAIRNRWRPDEMVFVSEGRLRRILEVAGSVVVLAALAVSGAWTYGWRRQLRARRQSDERASLLAHALQSANDCITISDTDERLMYVNEAFLRTYEYDEHEIIGQHVSILRAADADTSIVKALTETGAADGWRGEVWNKSKTGRVFPVSLAASMVRDERGKVIAAIGVARDETARTRLESQLRQAQKMDALGRFAAGIAHDFNNLLHIVLACCEDGVATRLLPPKAGVLFDEARAAAESASVLIRQLTTVSRPETARPRVVDLNRVVEDTRRLIERLTTGTVDVQVRCDPHLGRVVADAVLLQQVLVNLTVRARDAMPSGGRLSIETKNVGDRVRLAVSDTGAGMDTAVRPDGDTGVGLSTVYGIVERAGGVIRVESEPDAGTTFTIDLPRVDPRSAAAADADEHETGPAVVLVDDDPAVLNLLRRSLSRVGCHVVAASNGAGALALCAALGSSPALLITDIWTPDMRGPALAARLHDLYPRLRVLYVSGDADAPHREGLLPDDAHFLAKPFELSQFVSTVRAMLDW